MTHQDFNNLYYSFTGDEKGLRLHQRITMTGDELKEFLEFSIRKIEKNNNQYVLKF